MSYDINELRTRIDQINDEMLTLFIERMGLSAQVAQYKRDNKLPVTDRTREREILRSITEKAGDEMESYARVLFETLISLSKSYQAEVTTAPAKLEQKIAAARQTTAEIFPSSAVVACQGTEGSYSQHACDRIFPAGQIMFFGTFEGVFRAVEKGLCKYGVLPIENSSYGSVTEVYDLMKKHSFYIVRSTKLHVAHTLLAKPGTNLSNVTEIWSHEQALGQCSEFLSAHPNIKIHLCENTAIAAQRVAEADAANVAAIASRDCARLYGLEVLNDDVQNSPNNYTRFIIISREMEIYPGSNKLSLMLTTAHRPGALYEIISKFASLELNLTKLESRPISGTDFEFMFYFDVAASAASPAVLRLLSELSRDCEQFTFLGNYSEV